MSHRALNVALLGFGTVGASVARILVERPELAGRLQLTHVFNRDVARKRAPWMPATVIWTDDYAQVLAVGARHRRGGRRRRRIPAREWVSRAIERGSSVVTANKMLLAAHGPELLKAAATRGVELRFEAAVAGGVPLIHGVREGLAGDRLTGGRGHSQRHVQLHPQPDVATRTRRWRSCLPMRSGSATRKPIRAPTSMATTPRPSWSCWSASRSGGISSWPRSRGDRFGR